MKKSVSKNYIYNLIYQILIIFFPIMITPYLSRALGAENTGIFSYTYSIVTYFILIGGLGINLYAQKEIAYVQDKEKEKNYKFVELVLLKWITMLISLIIFIFLFCTHGKYSIFYTILIIEIIANMLDITWLFQGLEDFKKIIIRNLIIKFVSVILIFMFVKNSSDLKIYFWVYTLSNMIGNLSLWIKIPICWKNIEWKKVNILRHVKPILTLFLPQIAIQIYTVLDKTMLGILGSNMLEVGYYEYAQKFIQMSLMLLTSIGTVMLPHISYLHAQGKKQEVLNLIEKSFHFVFLIACPLIFGFLSVSKEFVNVFLGSQFSKSATIICIMTPIILFIGITNVIGYQYFLPTQKNKQYTISVICGAFTNFIGNLILIPKYNAVGAAIATVISEGVVLLVQLWYAREFPYSKILCECKNYIVASIFMFIVLLLFSNLQIGNLLLLCTKGFVGGFVYFVALILIRDPLMIEMLKRVKKHE